MFDSTADDPHLLDPHRFISSATIDPILNSSPQNRLELNSRFEEEYIAQRLNTIETKGYPISEKTITTNNSSDSLTGLSATAPLVSQSVSVNFGSPDLIISNASIPSSGTAGNSIDINYTVKNQGSATADSNSIHFYLSSDNRLSTDDQWLTSDYINPLAAGTSRSESDTVYLSNTVNRGNYYLFIYADAYDYVTESNENNNALSRSLKITKPDLLVSSASVPSSGTSGTSINVNYTLKNQGDGISSSPSVHFYLSKDTTYSSDDIFTGSDYPSSSLAPGATVSQTASIYLSDRADRGNYNLIVYVDGYDFIAESNENNNALARPIKITKPDLLVSSASVPSSGIPGNSITVNYTLKNQGDGVATSHSVYFYLSKDTTYSDDDIFTGSDYISSNLAAGASRGESSSIYLSDDIDLGNYNLLIYADAYDYVSETNENNNVLARSIKINRFVGSGGYNSSSGYGLVNASAAVAKALGQNPFANVPNLGGNNWGADLINAPEVWAKGYTGKGIVVAVVDTGVDRNHSDLSSNIWKNSKEIAGNGKDDDRNGYVDDVYGWNFVNNNNNTSDVYGHGTHVSGTIAGVKNNFGVTGIAYNAKIMPVKVLGDDGSGSNAGVAKGIRYAADNGAKVINLSLGGDTGDATLQSAVEYASKKGAIVVMAAGNSSGSQPIFPARYAKNWGIAVGAVDRFNLMADFSNEAGTDKLTYVTAPGVAVYSTLPNNDYVAWDGTSMATPHVAGVVALMLSAKSGLTDAQVRQILTSTAENVTGGVNNSRLSVTSDGSLVGVHGVRPTNSDRAIMSLGYPISEQIIEVDPHSQELVVSMQSELIASKQSQSSFHRTTRYDLESGDRDDSLASVIKTI